MITCKSCGKKHFDECDRCPYCFRPVANVNLPKTDKIEKLRKRLRSVSDEVEDNSFPQTSVKITVDTGIYGYIMIAIVFIIMAIISMIIKSLT